MKKVYIGVGHGGSDPGAVKYLVEKEINLIVSKHCRDYLKLAGVDTMMSREVDENTSLTEKIKEANDWGADLALDIHNNAGGGDGAEVFHSINYGEGKELAENILKEIKAIGQNSRGAKVKKNSRGTDYFGFIRSTSMPAVIVECVFVDKKADAEQIDEAHEQKAFGIAIAKGVLKTLGIADNVNVPTENNKPVETKEPISASNEGYLVKVTTDALRIRSDAGTNYPQVGLITDKGTYTIVEEKSGKGANKWGKLKSGAGWISLDWTKKV